jgi:hypothetical protein
MSDELSAEDLFRLNVLLTQDLKAVRLDEAVPALHALTDQGEASLTLNPNCRPDRYLRLVREFLSGHALGSPGGYPVHLTRWTRHGQMESENLGRLLLTGEPEAVAAVVHSPALSDQIAAYAWWAMPTIENARLMLRRAAVAHGRMGAVLAEFLVEHLPFLQEDNLAIMDTVAVLLYSGALAEAQRETIWRRGKRQNSHYVAFLEMCPEHLPSPPTARPGYEAVSARLAEAAVASPLLAKLLWAWSPQGQGFLAACQEILERPETQEVVSRSLNALGRQFALPDVEVQRTAMAAAWRPEWGEHGADLAALLALGQVSDATTTPIFARSTAIGSLMRRKIEPVIAPIQAHLRQLRGQAK